MALTLVVKDSDGSTIADVQATLASASNTDVQSTDGTGTVTLVTTGVEQSTLTLERIGYQTYTHVFTPASDDIEWEQTLSRIVPVAVRGDGSTIVNIDPSNPHNKIWV